MASFLTGLCGAAILAGVTVWALVAFTITMPERTQNLSLRLGDAWAQESSAGMSIPLVTKGNLGD